MARISSIALEIVSVDVPEAGLEVYEAALSSACATVGFFRNPQTGEWRVEGVKGIGVNEPDLAAALALAATLSGITAELQRARTPSDGWLARTYAAFPEQYIGRRFAVRGTHLHTRVSPSRITLTLDAGLAFGSGEHGSTRGCLRALERVAWRRPQRILDLGTGSGILAMAAAKLLHRHVLATDIDPWPKQVVQENMKLNGLRPFITYQRADGWSHPVIQRAAPYDLVFANILARPLCLMARQLAFHLARGGIAILSGLLRNQARSVLSAHRRCGITLAMSLQEGPWTTLVLRRSPGRVL